MKSPRYQPRSRKCLAWITSLLALTVIVLQVMQHDAVASASLKWSQLLPRYGWPLALATALLPLNWGIEALKWHLLLRRSRRSMNQSYREVLVGSTWGFLTPNRSGDAVARVALLPAEQRSLGLRSFGWSAWAQGGMTLTFGSLATAWFMSPLAAAAGTKVLWLIPMLALAGAAAWWTLGWANIRFGFNALMWLQQRFKLPTWLDPETIESDQARPHFPLIIALSAARYSVFTCQFALGLIAYGFGDVTVLIPAIAMVYWGNMIIPTAALAEMGVREALIVMVLQPAPEMVVPLMAGTFFIWSLNLVVPAVFGAIVGPRTMMIAHED
jgi:hypothetical protein